MGHSDGINKSDSEDRCQVRREDKADCDGNLGPSEVDEGAVKQLRQENERLLVELQLTKEYLDSKITTLEAELMETIDEAHEERGVYINTAQEIWRLTRELQYQVSDVKEDSNVRR